MSASDTPGRKATFQHLAEVSGLEHATYADWPLWKHTVPFPTPLMMGSSGTHQLETYLAVGSAWYQLIAHYLGSGAHVLDIGCGCAKIARFLATESRVRSYLGFDPIAECIAWNRRFVVPIAGERFRFEHIDLASAEYNPTGTVAAESFSFPAGSASVDIAIASSVFTHLLQPAAERYLAEAARVLVPGGKLILSLHTEPPAGQVFAGDEARIDVDLAFFIRLATERGLALHEDVGSFCGQSVLVLSRPG